MKKFKIFLALVAFSVLGAGDVFATTVTENADGTTSISDDGAMTFSVLIPETITVTVTKLKEVASGVAGEFLRNPVTLKVATNNIYGFSTTLKTKTSTTALTNTTNSSVTIPTLTTSTTQANFGNNYWGFSTNDESTVLSTSTYYPLLATGTTLTDFSANSATEVSGDIYFGMKADGTTLAGTYSNTVVIAVVGKTSGGRTEVDPTPTDDDDNPTVTEEDENTKVIVVNYEDNTTQRTVIKESETATTETTESSKSSYATPQGVTDSTVASSVNVGMIVAGAVAVASVTGLVLLVVTNKRDDDDEDEEE